MRIHPLLLTFALVATVQGAAAQAPPTATSPPPATAIAEADTCAPNTKSLARPNSEPGTTTGQAAELLGDKLAKSDGVLCPPPGVDPEIRAPTPAAGNTPVIRPPGTPGGNPDIRPK